MTMTPADIHPLILQRRSLRAIAADRPVPREVVDRLLEAARWAPSSGNTQPWRFVAVDESGALTRARAALKPGNRAWADAAPVLLLVCSNPEDDGAVNGQPLYLFDCGLATENLMLQGIAEGLVVHPMAGWNEDPLRAALDIPLPYRIVVVVAIGYPGRLEDLPEQLSQRETAERTRKALSDLTHYNAWNSPTTREDQ